MQKSLSFVLALSLLGIFPLFLGLAWVNGNMTLPGDIHRFFQAKMSWPWLSFEESSVIVRALIDLALIIAACALTALATRLPVSRIRRALIWICAGSGLFIVMSCWQYTGIIAWSVRMPLYVSDLIYWCFLAWGLWLGFAGLNAASVLGYSDFYREKTPVIPAVNPSFRMTYALALAFFLTPILSLDRLLFCGVTLLFLTILFKFSRLAKANSPC